MSNKINSNEIIDKFDEFHNGINVIKTKVINEMKLNEFFFKLNPNNIFLKNSFKTK